MGGVLPTAPRFRSVRMPAGVLVAVLVGMLSVGCSDDHPPWNCDWYPAPDGLTTEDLHGDYTVSITGKPERQLHLDRAGTYTTSGFTYGDWITATSVTFPAGKGRWEPRIGKEEGWAVPFVDVPFLGGRETEVRSVNLFPEKGNRTELHVGGTRERPALAELSLLAGDDCATWTSLFRQT